MHIILHYMVFIFNIYLFLATLHLSCCSGFSLVVESRGHALVVAPRLLTAVASLVVEHRL